MRLPPESGAHMRRYDAWTRMKTPTPARNRSLVRASLVCESTQHKLGANMCDGVLIFLRVVRQSQTSVRSSIRHNTQLGAKLMPNDVACKPICSRVVCSVREMCVDYLFNLAYYKDSGQQ